MKRIAIFASGSGSNAEVITSYFDKSKTARVVLIVSNKPKAYVLERAHRLGVKTIIINRKSFYESNEVVNRLIEEKIDLIVLAGFLWLIPENLIASFPEKIINIHPSLLPKYGGKGMYGKNVHKAVKDAGEKETGITIHYVNSEYDKGKLIAQFKTSLSDSDEIDEIARKVQVLEHEHFPKEIEKILA